MRKFILTALLAATVLPAAAQAQDGYRQDRRDIQDDRRGPDHGNRGDDRRFGDGRRDDRGAIADRDRRFGRDDWRGWRDRNGGLYAAGNWRAPFRYTQFRPGVRIAPDYYGTRYVVVDPWRYHLPPAQFGQRWVRHYNDVVLVDPRRGTVVDVIRGFYR